MTNNQEAWAWALFEKGNPVPIKVFKDEDDAKDEISARNAGKKGGWEQHEVKKTDRYLAFDVKIVEERIYKRQLVLDRDYARVLWKKHEQGALRPEHLTHLVDLSSRPNERKVGLSLLRPVGETWQ